MLRYGVVAFVAASASLGCGTSATRAVSSGVVDGGLDASPDATADAGCTATPYCQGGHIASYCCPAGYKCQSLAYCDTGGGSCLGEPCPDAGHSCDFGDAGGGAWFGNLSASCQTDGDCAFVYIGYRCDCDCPNASINQASLPAYNAYVDDAGGFGNLCDCATIPKPTCVSGVCMICLPALYLCQGP